jgi:uncharacterized protein YndB with AHSA1/START domain
MYGTYEEIDGRPAVRFERRYPHPVERVWRAVTEPGELVHWFPTTVEVDLREGGEMAFTFPGGEMEPMEGSVTVLDPPHRFAFLWGEEELRIELEPDGDGCRLEFTHLISSRDAAARNAAGWHLCLDRLGSLLSSSGWSELYEEYQRRGVPAGAPIPGRS